MPEFTKKLTTSTTFYNAESGGQPPTCGCGSWKKHWLRYAGGHSNFQCLNAKCKSRCHKDPKKRKIIITDFDGSHIVFQSNSPDQYVVPLCQTCNRSRDKSFMKPNRKCIAVLENKGDKCGPDRAAKLNRFAARMLKRIAPPKA